MRVEIAVWRYLRCGKGLTAGVLHVVPFALPAVPFHGVPFLSLARGRLATSPLAFATSACVGDFASCIRDFGLRWRLRLLHSRLRLALATSPLAFATCVGDLSRLLHSRLPLALATSPPFFTKVRNNLCKLTRCLSFFEFFWFF